MGTSSRVRRAGVVLLAAGAAVWGHTACGGDGDVTEPEPPPEPTVASVEVTPEADTLTAIGAETSFDATALDSDGNAIQGAAISWSSSDQGVATVDGTGTVTARGNGEATITASSGGESGTATVAVDQQVSSVEISPSEASLVVGDTEEFSADAEDANGNAVADASVAWRSTDTAVVEVDSTGTAAARDEGEASVIASSSGVEDSAAVSVREEAAAVSVSPDSAGANALDATVDFDAAALDAADDTIPGVSFTWSSSDTLVATVDGSGVATARGNGAATITAATSRVSGSATFTVDQEVASVTVSPDSATVTVGATARFSAEAEDANGNEVAGAGVAWSTTDESVATVDDTGLVTGESEGSARVAAESGGEADTAEVEVVAEAAGSVDRVGGDGQNARTLQEFSDPLTVEVTDGEGDPIDGATVDWAVVSGEASLSSQSTTTAADGRTSVAATSDTLLLEHEVRASVTTQEVEDSVTFQLETTAAYFEVGDNFFEDWQGRRNEDFRADGNISVGDSVVWEYVEGGTVHTVTSGEGQDGDDGDGVPSGGTMFDSRNLEEGDTFVWVPDAAGTWTYFCEIHPTVMFDSVIIVDEDGSSDRTAAASRYEPGDVVQPEGSHLKFIYLGPPAEGRGR